MGTSRRFPSVPQFRPFLKEKLCGTDGRALKLPLPPSVPGQGGTDGNGRERTGNAITPTRTTKPDPMNAHLILDSSPVAKFIAIIQQDRFSQMVAYLDALAERAALAAEREAAKQAKVKKPKKGKRGRPRKTRRSAAPSLNL